MGEHVSTVNTAMRDIWGHELNTSIKHTKSCHDGTVSLYPVFEIATLLRELLTGDTRETYVVVKFINALPIIGHGDQIVTWAWSVLVADMWLKYKAIPVTGRGGP
jgi:hypothetical protein